MHNFLVRIPVRHISEFKSIAIAIANYLNSQNPAYRIKGRSKVELLAKVCGYTSFSQITILAKNVEDQDLSDFYKQFIPSNISRNYHDNLVHPRSEYVSEEDISISLLGILVARMSIESYEKSSLSAKTFPVPKMTLWDTDLYSKNALKNQQ